MSDPSPLPVAVEGDTIEGADLQPSIDNHADHGGCAGRADPERARRRRSARTRPGRTRPDEQATTLATAQVKVLVGEARVSAEHVNAAAAYAKGVVATIASWQKAVRVAGEVVAFFVAVEGGQGGTIVKSAVALKIELDEA